MKKILTSYINPDMDGISCMYAYKEFLEKKGESSEYYFEGTMKREAKIVLETFNIKLNITNKINEDDNFVLLDTNYLSEVPTSVKKDRIIEIIDHHKKENWFDGKNIKTEIEPLGAAATIIAEKFKKNKIQISRESAILLYYGIISNTMNLKIKMTTQRDIEMAKWLKMQAPEINEETTKQIFIKKSEIGNTLREEMEVEMKDQFMTISWSMGQLEIANAEEFLEKYETNIRNILETVSKQNDVEYISVNCMDIINGYSIIVAGNEKTANIIQNTTGFEFENLKSKTKELISRKEIVKIMRQHYGIDNN